MLTTLKLASHFTAAHSVFAPVGSARDQMCGLVLPAIVPAGHASHAPSTTRSLSPHKATSLSSATTFPVRPVAMVGTPPLSSNASNASITVLPPTALCSPCVGDRLILGGERKGKEFTFAVACDFARVGATPLLLAHGRPSAAPSMPPTSGAVETITLGCGGKSSFPYIL